MNETRSGGATGTLTGVALRTDIGAEIFPTAEPSCAATSSSHSMVNHALKHEVVVTYSGSRTYRVIAYSYCANVPRGTQVPLRYAIDAGGRRRRQDGFNIFHSVLRSARGDEEDVVVLHGEVCVLGLQNLF